VGLKGGWPTLPVIPGRAKHFYPLPPVRIRYRPPTEFAALGDDGHAILTAATFGGALLNAVLA